MAVCPSCQRENPVASPYCPACGAPMTAETRRREENLQSNSLNAHLLGMKWYKFLVFFSLPLSLLMNGYNLFQSLSSLKNFDPSLYYPEYLDAVLLSLRVGTGLTFLALIAMALAEWGLLKRRWLGAVSLFFTYGLQLINLLFSLYLLHSVQLSTDMLPMQIITSFLMLMGNIVYFRKRKALFHQKEKEISSTF